MQPWRPDPAAGAGDATVDEASMERSKSFVKALQELKNLRPQLYSAAEYCEKSYLHSEQKQMVLDNLKGYAVRAVVNAVDHLGTVAYKLTDLFEQQVSEVPTLELKVACLNQQILTCQTSTDKEGLRRQQMMESAIKHHKHYILPSNKINQAFAAQLHTDADQESKLRPYPSAKTLSWHLASDNSATSNGAYQYAFVLGQTGTSKPASNGFHLLGKEQPASPLPRHLQLNRDPSSDIVAQRVGVKDQPSMKHFSAFSYFDNPRGRAIQKAPVRTKSMLAAFFVKHKSAKMEKISVR